MSKEEIVYDICQNHIPRLRHVIEKMVKDLSKLGLTSGEGQSD